MECPKCHSQKRINYGKVLNKQRYRCKGCGYQYTKAVVHRYPEEKVARVVALYESGQGSHTVAKLMGCSTETVMRWARGFTPYPTGRAWTIPEKRWRPQWVRDTYKLINDILEVPIEG